MDTPTQNRIGALEAQLSVAREAIDKRLDEFEVARRALRWMLEHRVWWSPATQSLRQGNGDLCVMPPDDVHVFIQQLAVEISLEAEHAG